MKKEFEKKRSQSPTATANRLSYYTQTYVFRLRAGSIRTPDRVTLAIEVIDIYMSLISSIDIRFATMIARRAR